VRKPLRDSVVGRWSSTTVREKLVKIGAKVVSHGRYVTFRLAEVAVPRALCQKIHPETTVFPTMRASSVNR